MLKKSKSKSSNRIGKEKEADKALIKKYEKEGKKDAANWIRKEKD